MHQEQKLYDLGSTIADVTGSLTPKSSARLSDTAVDPHDLLWGILHSLASIRGSQSYLFPTLLHRCKSVLGFDCTITMGSFLPPLAPASAGPGPGSGAEGVGVEGWSAAQPEPPPPPPPTMVAQSADEEGEMEMEMTAPSSGLIAAREGMVFPDAGQFRI